MQQLSIDNELTIFTASDQKPRLLEFLATGNDLEIDLSKVAEIDTAGLQLLILLKREAAQAGKPLRFALHSKAVLDVLELTNLTHAFGDQIILARHPE